MAETELIRKIQELRKIKPRKDWVVLVKKDILGEEPSFIEKISLVFNNFPQIFFQFKPAFATLTLALVLLASALIFAQESLPGDTLYSLKRIGEESQTVFVSETEKPKAQLELANKRLEELNKIADANQVENLAPAINEFKAGAFQAAKEISKSKNIDVKDIVKVAKKLEENKQKVENLGIVIGETEELDDALGVVIEKEIKDLEERLLSEKGSETLAEIKKDYASGNLSTALEKILLLSQ
ncbi:DUF5667 domain-containing protein [Patescibacteria group bacterium]